LLEHRNGLIGIVDEFLWILEAGIKKATARAAAIVDRVARCGGSDTTATFNAAKQVKGSASFRPGD